MRILLIEDDVGLGSAVRDQLEAEGHSPDWAQTVAEAGDAARVVPDDLILLDLMLPDGGGLTLLRKLRAKGSATPVIILTARDRITEQIEGLSSVLGRRGAQDLSPLPDMALPSELAPIREAANRRMARLWHALEAERSFASNAAHELRTPIAATLAHTQRLIAEAPVGPLRDRATRVEGELKRMARLAEKLLQLARAEGGGVVAERPRDMVPILAALIDDLGRDLRPGRIVLTLPDTPVPSRLDPDAFAVLARNLVENALLHGAPDTAVAVALTPARTLQVTNDPAPLPAETLARLTRRFECNGSRAAGSGLGLTIARSIAVAIKRDLRLVSPLPGQARGLRVEVDIGQGES